MVLLTAAAAGFMISSSGLAQAQTATTESGTTTVPDASAMPSIEVIQVSGLIDPVVVSFIETSIDRAVKNRAQAMVIQMNAKDAVVSDERMAELAERIANSPIAVGIWVGPSGAKAYGAPGQLLGAAAARGIAPGSRVGNFGDPLPISDDIELATAGAADRLRNGTIGYQDSSLIDAIASSPTLGDFVIGLHGLSYEGTTLSTAQVRQTDDGPRQALITRTLSYKLTLIDQLMHTVASPPVAYLLLVIGLLLLVFEFFTAGVGIAGMTGVGCLILGGYGVAVLPYRTWALALIVVACIAFSIDVQTSVPRFWTGAGMVMFVIGSVWLWDGVSMSWIALATGIIGTLFAVLTGMPSMVRTRFATPTIGRAGMVGEIGDAVTAVSPDGIVRVRDAQWKAHTNRATPLAPGDKIRVVAIDGTTLEVEPEQGGARDYRERRPANA
ncbi:MAG: nodulation protein NfeD [Acidimicrobiia bacterium]